MKKATREQTKAHNNRLVLKTIYDEGQTSRADVARATGLTRTTVSDVVSELIEDGLVAEVAIGPSAGGKPPILLSVVPDSRNLIGIDLANSVFRGAVVNLRGEVKYRASLPIEDQDGEAAIDLVYQLIDDLLPDGPVTGIGIGTPGLMDARRGVVREAVNLNWRNLPLGDLLEERYGVPVYIANDSQVAALGEYTFGASKGVSNLIVIKVGRGIGAGIVLNGQLYYGETFGAGEIGHVAVVEDGELCRCGNRGCLETVSSSRAMVRLGQEALAQGQAGALTELAAASEELSTDLLLEAFQQDDLAVKGIVDQAGHYLGVAVANLVSILNIQRIVIAGSAARFGSGLIDPLRAHLAETALPALAAQTEIEISSLGTDVVILGAAALLLANEIGIS